MSAKIKSGAHLLYPILKDNTVYFENDTMIINFYDRYTYQSFAQKYNHLIIDTTDGLIDIVFTGETPKLEFESFCKDQLILKVVKEEI